MLCLYSIDKIEINKKKPQTESALKVPFFLFVTITNTKKKKK